MIRIGIDVGGTFTDVVAVDAFTRSVVARVKVPTTHAAPEGVAAGIVAGLQRVLEFPEVGPDAIVFIAHSTTQATNALLEGDVARVGVIGLLDGHGLLARWQIRLPVLDLGAGVKLQTETLFVQAGDQNALRIAFDELSAQGVEAIAVSDAFGVDRPTREEAIVTYAREHGMFATSGHEVASLYGLRARTRTAVLNAAILPTMVRTAKMTARAVEDAGIHVPLMIMRSDGGVMDVREVARRPILTMLSGPAAGIAGALLHENVTDGIFIEVGGTSADLSVIRRGLPQMRPARIGKHRTMLRTLDVRTIAIAGGSLPRFDPHGRGVAALRDIGPRSAHIAGLKYACFTPIAALDGARIALLQPNAGDPDAYFVLDLVDGTRATLTPTCAANLLGYVAESAFARGDPLSARVAMEIIAKRLECEPEVLARAILTRCAQRVQTVIAELVDEYELDSRTLEIVGGGGGAAAIVPFVAQALGLRHRLARDAEVISPIGVALALVRDVVERTIVNPSPDDIVRVRREAIERVVAVGASPALIEVVVEIDARRNLVRATASGATAASAQAARSIVGASERLQLVARAALVDRRYVRLIAQTGSLEACIVERGREQEGYIVDCFGIVRLIARCALVRATTVELHERVLRAILDEATSFGDVGRALPEIHLAYGLRVTGLGALAEAEQVIALAAEELRGLDPSTPIVIVASRRTA